MNKEDIEDKEYIELVKKNFWWIVDGICKWGAIILLCLIGWVALSWCLDIMI